MTEKELKLLGFEKNIDPGVLCEDNLGRAYTEGEYHYYVYTVTPGLKFISCSSDEETAKEDNWYVEFFETQDPIRFWNFGEVQGLINIFEKAKRISNEQVK